MRTHKLRLAIAIGLTGILAFAFAASARSAGLLERAQNSGITLAYSPEPPFSFLSADGKVTGEAPEVATAVLKSMGITKLNWVNIEWSSLIPGLQSNRFDMIAAGMFITPARCAVASFTDPSFVVGQGLVVKAGNPLNLHSYDDIAKNPKVRFATLSGGAGVDYAKEAKIPESQVSLYPDGPGMLAALKAGRADAISLAGPSLTQLLDKAKDPTIERVTAYTEPPSFKGYPAFVGRKDDADFIKAFNEKLNAFVGTPEHLALVREFGITKDDLEGRKKASEICK
jgi:polar amino acid transport system substrate-binding protein